MSNLELITFRRVDKKPIGGEGEAISAQFNPEELTFSKAAQIAEIAIPGLDSPILQFVRGQNETLSLDLFFDTTDQGMAGSDVEAVTKKTDRFYQLIKIDGSTHAPPILQVSWGENQLAGSQMEGPWASQNRPEFQCLLESVEQRFTLFSPEGVPLRATLSVKLREYRTLEKQITDIDFQSADHTHGRVVQEGDTLAAIAAEVYDDPAQWRAIARHNGIVDPQDLPAGLVLEIPPLV